MAMLMASAAITIKSCLRLTARTNEMGGVSRAAMAIYPLDQARDSVLKRNQSNLIITVNSVLFHAK